MTGFVGVRSKKRLGQVFLVNPAVAEAEAAHAHDKVVIEIGPGPGILTRQLCNNAKKVIAVEKDSYLCKMLKVDLRARNLKLINKDFLDASDDELEVDKADIVIANIPYYLSSSMIEWLAERKMQAVLCLQKEFVEHMLAQPDTRNYSKLSVISALLFKITKIMEVPRGNFRPMPKVDSEVIYIKPLDVNIPERQIFLLGLLMQHKKKTVRNAVIDSSSYLGMDKHKLAGIAERMSQKKERVFKMSPDEILKTAEELQKLLE